MKLTKKQTETLKTIWTERTAYGLVHQDRTFTTGITTAAARKLGFGKLNGNAAYSLRSKGLIRVLTTNVTFQGQAGTFLVQVAVLTDKGRAAAGV
ncbi:hypothetical protein SEA_XKCD426_67 [Streptomyces phage Xkcd426]|nr:hypothetical protein SEA_XKCD426_67 [Streptomyces phage Xkcd426]